MLALAQPGALRFQHLSLEDGLSQNNAVDIVQDRFGFLWFATQDGVNRFDGYEFVVFSPDPDTPGTISHNYINQLLVATDGQLWAGSRGGLHRFDHETQRFTNYMPDPDDPTALPDAIVTVLMEDSQQRLWVGTERRGLSRYDPDTGGFITYSDFADGHSELLDQHLTALLEDDDGSLLVGTQAGLHRFDPASGVFQAIGDFDHPGGLSDRHITALWRTRDGVLWVGTINGLNQQRPDGGFSPFYNDPDDPHSLSGNAVNTLFEDANGNLWVGTVQGLSLSYGEGGFVNYLHQSEDPFSISGNDVKALFEDVTGVIWAGTDGSGINRVDPLGMGFAHLGIGLDHPSGIVFPHAWAILVDSRDELWVGAETTGISHYRNEEGRFEHFVADPDDPKALGSDHVNAVIEDDRGVLWFGTDFAGLHRFDRNSGEFQRYEHDPDDPTTLSNNNIYALLEDYRNHLWVGTNSGVDRLEPRRLNFTRFAHDPENPESLSDPGVRSLYEGSDGSIWVGTRRGLNRIDPLSGRVERITAGINGGDDLATNWILSIREASNGDFWFGTIEGLYRMTPEGTVSRFGEKDGLPNDVIYGILIDAAERLWLSTNRGIAMFDPTTGEVESFDSSHGLQANEFNQGAFFRDDDGRMYFGGINGITAFKPEEITQDPFPPRVVLTDFRLFNRSVPLSSPENPTPLDRHILVADAITLGHQDSVFTFDFAALHYADPMRNHYAYRLVGLSEEWIETTARRRSATFTSLPPGDYVFQVKASNRAGLWSNPPAKVNLTILPPPWRTGWAYAGYAALVILVVGSVTRAQYNKLRERAVAQRAIAQSEERLRLALWGSGDELWDWDIATGELVRMNPIETDTPDPISRKIDDLDDVGVRIHPDDQPVLKRALKEHFDGKTDHFEVTCRLDDGKGGWTWVIDRGRVAERDEQGKPLRLTGTSKDVSALKAAEQALKELNERLEERVGERTEALQKANLDLTESIHQLRKTQSQLTEAEKMATLGNLVAGVAHEINTPVGVSVTAASHLVEQTRRFQEQLDGDADPAALLAFQQSASACAELILKNLDRAAQLISSFKQVAVDQSSERKRQFELSGYLTEILTSLRPRIDRSGHQVELECPKGIVMDTFPGALYQVLSNLIINSLTHGFEDQTEGMIRITAVPLGDHSVRIGYRDNGSGMSDDIRAHIFEPFFTTKRGSGGSGLGMHIAYNLVTQGLQGTLSCGEAPGGGALFELVVPKVVRVADESESPAA